MATSVRIALANLRFPATPVVSVTLVERSVAEAAGRGATVLCFPECYVPGYRAPDKRVPPPNPEFLERAWTKIADQAGKSGISVVLGTERIVEGAVRATVL